MHRLRATAFGEIVEHAQQCRQSGTARYQDQRFGHVPQIEGAQRCLQHDVVAHLAAITDVVAHDAIGQQANQELQLIVLTRPIGKRVGTLAFGPGNRQPRVLPRQKIQWGRRAKIQVQDRGAG
ncbi:hypothetical protein D9M71_470350 [compost metagenome]